MLTVGYLVSVKSMDSRMRITYPHIVNEKLRSNFLVY